MRFLKLCFVLMVLGFSAKAQEKDTCFYHVSFYKWEWDYCYGRDTLQLQGIDGYGIVEDTFNFPPIFSIGEIDTSSFRTAHLEVTSMDGKIKYKITDFEIQVRLNHSVTEEILCEGAYLNTEALMLLRNIQSANVILLDKIRIHAPNLQKQILLPLITIIGE